MPRIENRKLSSLVSATCTRVCASQAGSKIGVGVRTAAAPNGDAGAAERAEEGAPPADIEDLVDFADFEVDDAAIHDASVDEEACDGDRPDAACGGMAESTTPNALACIATSGSTVRTPSGIITFASAVAAGTA